jgi:hypothetical protein
MFSAVRNFFLSIRARDDHVCQQDSMGESSRGERQSLGPRPAAASPPTSWLASPKAAAPGPKRDFDTASRLHSVAAGGATSVHARPEMHKRKRTPSSWTSNVQITMANSDTYRKVRARLLAVPATEANNATFTTQPHRAMHLFSPMGPLWNNAKFFESPARFLWAENSSLKSLQVLRSFEKEVRNENEKWLQQLPPVAARRLDARRKMLTKEQVSEVFQRIFSGGDPEEVLVEKFNIPLTREKLQCLQEGTWLNDEVINFYMQLLLQRDRAFCALNPNRRPSHFFNSFFLEKLVGQHSGGYNFAGVKKWTKKAKIDDVFELEKIFFPVNIDNTHWCMAAVYPQQKRIQYYDSFGGRGDRYTSGLKNWLHDEHQAKKGCEWDDYGWEVVPSQKDVPRQRNGVDCGVFSCMFASYLSEDLPFKFSQADMADIRLKLAWQLVHAQIE